MTRSNLRLEEYDWDGDEIVDMSPSGLTPLVYDVVRSLSLTRPV
jgi:hypothetical protein